MYDFEPVSADAWAYDDACEYAESWANDADDGYAYIAAYNDVIGYDE